MGNNLAEYVVKLSANIDNEGARKILDFLSSAKFKALGVTAALGAATTAVYKFVESATKKEFELQKLSKTQKKHIEDLRAQKMALEAMGMTLKDIEKDKALKSIYKDLVAFNKELEMPNMERALNNVRDLQGAFWKLRSIVNYAVQAIGDKVLINLEAPLKRMTGYLGEISDWFKKNYEIITSRGAMTITAFAKGVFGIFEAFKQIGGLVDKLPSGIKAAAGAMAALFALIKSGPIGQILALVTAVGDVIHDYEVYQYNKENGYDVGNENHVGNLNDIWGIWDLFESGDTPGEKASNIALLLIGKLTDAMNNAWSTEEGQNSLGTFLNGENGEGGLLGGLTTWLNDHSTEIGGLGEAFIHFITQSVREVGGFAGGAAGGLINAIFGVDENGVAVVPDSVFEDKTTGTTFATMIGTFFSGFVGKMKKGGTLYEAFKEGLGQGALGTLLGALVSNTDVGPDGAITIDWESIGVDVTTVGQSFVNMVAAGITGVKSIGKTLFTAIGSALAANDGGDSDSFVGEIGSIIGDWGKEDSILGNAISLGVTGWFSSGNLGIGIITSLGSLIADLADNPEAIEQFKQETAVFGQKLSKVLVGELNEETGNYEGGIIGAIGELFSGIWSAVSPYLEPLWEGIKEGFSTLGAELWGIISPYISYILYQIESAFANTTIGKMLGIKPGQNTYGIDQFGNIENFEMLGYMGYSDEQKLEANKALMGNAAAQKAVELGLTGSLFAYHLDKGGGILTPERLAAMQRDFGDNWTENVDYSQFDFRTAYRQILQSGNAGAMSEFAKYYKDLQNGGDYWDARKGVESIIAGLETPVEGKLDTAGLQAQAASTTLHVDVIGDLTIMGNSSGSGGKKILNHPVALGRSAVGGRYGRRTSIEVGEEGSEYVIPIERPDQAVNLTLQMLNEMGSAAVRRVMEGLGIGQEGTVGASYASMKSLPSGMNLSPTYNISAPVNINVTSNGADAKDVGNYVYDMAERNLIRNLQGVLG